MSKDTGLFNFLVGYIPPSFSIRPPRTIRRGDASQTSMDFLPVDAANSPPYTIYIIIYIAIHTW